MEDFEQYLNEDADEGERRAARQVRDGLTGLRLEARVREVAAERATLLRRAFWLRVRIAVAALVLVMGAGYFLFREKGGAALAPTKTQQQEQGIDPPANNPPPPAEKKDDAKANKPIAQVRPAGRLPDPRYPAPDATMIRGDEEANKAQKALLDQIWYTNYPLSGLIAGNPFTIADANLKKRDFTAAYLELGRLEGQLAQNDTLLYLKGYCLLEMGEGEEALTYFDRLQGRHVAWEPQLQWYRGLALMLANKRAEAVALFKKITAQPGHPYRRQAEKAVGLLSK